MVEELPSVAELPICQKTLQAWAPRVSKTLLEAAVIRVFAVLKIKTDVGSFRPSKVSVPFMTNVPPEYAPLVSVVEPSSTGRETEVRRSENAEFA